MKYQVRFQILLISLQTILHFFVLSATIRSLCLCCQSPVKCIALVGFCTIIQQLHVPFFKIVYNSHFGHVDMFQLVSTDWYTFWLFSKAWNLQSLWWIQCFFMRISPCLMDRCKALCSDDTLTPVVGALYPPYLGVLKKKCQKLSLLGNFLLLAYSIYTYNIIIHNIWYILHSICTYMLRFNRSSTFSSRPWALQQFEPTYKRCVDTTVCNFSW